MCEVPTVCELGVFARESIRAGADMDILLRQIEERFGKGIAKRVKIGRTGIGILHIPSGTTLDLTKVFDGVPT